MEQRKKWEKKKTVKRAEGEWLIEPRVWQSCPYPVFITIVFVWCMHASVCVCVHVRVLRACMSVHVCVCVHVHERTVCVCVCVCEFQLHVSNVSLLFVLSLSEFAFLLFLVTVGGEPGTSADLLWLLHVQWFAPVDQNPAQHLGLRTRDQQRTLAPACGK